MVFTVNVATSSTLIGIEWSLLSKHMIKKCSGANCRRYYFWGPTGGKDANIWSTALYVGRT
jgi:hypothetical protein